MQLHGIKTKAKALNYAAIQYLEHRKMNSELSGELVNVTDVLETFFDCYKVIPTRNFEQSSN